MVVCRSNHAIILITGAEYVRISYHARGDRDTMSEAKLMPLSDSYTSGTYVIVSPDQLSPAHILTSDDENTSEEDHITETSTESSKKLSREELVVNLVTAIMPEVENILQRGELDLIKEKYVEIGAINAYLDSIDAHLTKLNRTFDEAFEKYDAIKARF